MRITKYRGGARSGKSIPLFPLVLIFVTTVSVVLFALTYTVFRKPRIETEVSVAKAAPEVAADDRSELSTKEPAAPEPAPAPPEAVPSGPAWDIQKPLNRRWTGDFQEMRKIRIIRALVVYSRTLYFLDGARERGATYEYLKEFEKSINRQYNTGHLPIHILFVPVNRDELLPGLLEGRGDIAAANLTITEERSKQVDFSQPIVKDVRELVVTGPAAPRLNRLEDLAGKEVGVRASSSYFEHLRNLNKSFRERDLAEIRIRQLDENLESEDILEMVNAGLVPMTVVDGHIADLWRQIYPEIRVRTELVVHSGGQIAWAFRPHSPQLKKLADSFIQSRGKGSLFGNILSKKYFSDVAYIKNNINSEDLKKYRATVGYFRKYAKQYKFDYLMMTAQGYQESGLDQSRRSRSGAVGVMQIKPTTAADRNVNIRDITRMENNIHAGIKYMRFVMDTYFRNEPMDDLNRGLFAVASYNAGPGRIAQLRKKASGIGLNPNVWFRNVEVVAAREIGRETVQYVSNIFKYYLAYKKLEEKEQQKSLAFAGSLRQE